MRILHYGIEQMQLLKWSCLNRTGFDSKEQRVADRLTSFSQRRLILQGHPMHCTYPYYFYDMITSNDSKSHNQSSYTRILQRLRKATYSNSKSTEPINLELFLTYESTNNCNNLRLRIKNCAAISPEAPIRLDEIDFVRMGCFYNE